jgi:hypothetical protein
MMVVKKDLGQVAAGRGLKEATIISHLVQVIRFAVLSGSGSALFGARKRVHWSSLSRESGSRTLITRQTSWSTQQKEIFIPLVSRVKGIVS